MTTSATPQAGTATQQTEAEQILSMVEQKFGFRPNLVEEMVTAPAAARVYLGGQEAMAEGVLTPVQQQAVQLAVATENECHYCTAAHSGLARQAGLPGGDVETILDGRLPDNPDVAPVVEATRRVMNERGWLDADDLQDLEARGVDRARLYEIVTLVGLKTISNYINHIADTEVDPQFGG